MGLHHLHHVTIGIAHPECPVEAGCRVIEVDDAGRNEAVAAGAQGAGSRIGGGRQQRRLPVEQVVRLFVDRHR